MKLFKIFSGITKALTLLILPALLLTSCQNGSNIEQSSYTSESAQSSSSPEEAVTLFGKPLNEIDWSPAISKNYETMFREDGFPVDGYEHNNHETAVFLRKIILAYSYIFHQSDYPSAIEKTDQYSEHINTIDEWVYFAISRIRDGFHGKTWADYPYHGEPFPDGFIPQYSIPAEDIADCLSSFFVYPGDMLKKIRCAYQYRPDTDTIDEPQYGWGGHPMGCISIDSVAASSQDALLLRYSVWDFVSFFDTSSDRSYEAFLQKAEKNYTMEMTVRITSDEDAKWQIISCENKNK